MQVTEMKARLEEKIKALEEEKRALLRRGTNLRKF